MAPDFDLLKIALQQIDVFPHKFLKTWFLFQFDSGFVGYIDCIWYHCFIPPLDFVRKISMNHGRSLMLNSILKVIIESTGKSRKMQQIKI